MYEIYSKIFILSRHFSFGGLSWIWIKTFSVAGKLVLSGGRMRLESSCIGVNTVIRNDKS